MRKKRDWVKNPPISCPERMAFLVHRIGAPKRGIDFQFTYEEWLAWWESHLGPDWLELRGNMRGKYVMARNKDEGPYAAWNVRCILMEENIKEGTQSKKRGNAKLTHAEAGAIYLALKSGRRGIITKLACEYGVSETTIHSIRDKVTWDHVTDLLD